MVFSSLLFLCIFLPAVILLYFLMPNMTGKNLLLTLASLVFYAVGEPVWVVLLIFSALIHYLNGLLMERFRGSVWEHVCFWTAVALSLGMLCCFKYLNFLVGNLNLLLGLQLPQSGLSLPIGISFYTFQTLSYTIDLRKGQAETQHSFLDFLLFVSLFPQLIAGPILRYSDLAAQLRRRSVTAEGFARGSCRFVCGLAKKVLLANYCSEVVEKLLVEQPPAQLSAVGAWLGILMYAFQLYFDFSGYSDMAIGLGAMFGFHYGENFRYPYIARSITDFWRRWHISLGSWFRDYVYYPLGGSRRGLARQLVNLLVVWLLTGLWHGAGWNYILWGLWFGVLLIIEKMIGKERLGRIPAPLAIPVTFLLVLLGRVFFFFEDAASSMAVYRAMLGFNGLTDTVSRLSLTNSLPLLIACFIGSTPLLKKLGDAVCAYSRKWLGEAVGFALPALCYNSVFLALCIISLVGATSNPFIYFRF